MGILRIAETLAAELEKRFPESTGVRFNYVPAPRGQLALNTRQPARALDALAPSKINDLAATEIGIYNYYGNLCPIYVRRLAYLLISADHGKEAAQQFQSLLQHRGLLLADPIGPAARLQLA